MKTLQKLTLILTLLLTINNIGSLPKETFKQCFENLTK